MRMNDEWIKGRVDGLRAARSLVDGCRIAIETGAGSYTRDQRNSAIACLSWCLDEINSEIDKAPIRDKVTK